MFGTKLFMHGEGSSSAVIPEGVEIIGEEAFLKDDIEGAVIPESVKIIEEGAFSSCLELKSVTMPDNIETIGKYAFSGCVKLNEIVLPANLKNLEKNTFHNCIELKKVKLPEKLKAIGDDVFINIPGESLTLEGIIPAMLNGCKISAKTGMWLLDNLWNDENHTKEVVVFYLTQSGTKVIDKASLLLWRNSNQAIAIMREIQNSYKLRNTVQKRINAFIEQNT